jgi:hypothetical protein
MNACERRSSFALRPVSCLCFLARQRFPVRRDGLGALTLLYVLALRATSMRVCSASIRAASSGSMHERENDPMASSHRFRPSKVSARNQLCIGHSLNPFWGQRRTSADDRLFGPTARRRKRSCGQGAESAGLSRHRPHVWLRLSLVASFRWRQKSENWQAIANWWPPLQLHRWQSIRPSTRTGDDVRQSLTKGNGTMKLGRFVPLFLDGIALIAGAPL